MHVPLLGALGHNVVHPHENIPTVSREVVLCSIPHATACDHLFLPEKRSLAMTADTKSTADPKAQVKNAEELLKTDVGGGIAALRGVISVEGTEPELIQAKEQAIGSLTTALADTGDATGLRELLATLRPLYANFAKAKTARIVRTVIDALARVPNTAKLQV